MELKDLLKPAAVVDLHEADKWRVLMELARRGAAFLDVRHEAIADALLKRENLGSTVLGDGIALPHARIGGVDKPFGLFARLKPAVHFDAIDERPVDIAFLLLLPDRRPEEQLKSMACVARRLRDPVLASKLRAARGALSLYTLLTAR